LPAPPRTEVPAEARFRQVLGHFCTGVTVITTDGPLGPAGFACQAFAALSLEPPLVLFCPSRGRYAATDPGEGPAEVVDTLLAWPRHADWM
jgi:flavin reductase (DIM6/NTAB) family NADH-FMN oxidoreductase RutF